MRPSDGKFALLLVEQERTRQKSLLSSGRIAVDLASPHVDDTLKYVVLGEEFGEVARAMLEDTPSHLKAELIQLAACAVAWAEAL